MDEWLDGEWIDEWRDGLIYFSCSSYSPYPLKNSPVDDEESTPSEDAEVDNLSESFVSAQGFC